MPAGRSEAVAALLLPPAVALAARPRGDGLSAAGRFLPLWAVLILILWVAIAVFVPGPWGRAERVGACAVASLVAALAAWIFER